MPDPTYAIPVCLLCDAPAFTTQPSNQTADDDGNATFTVVVSGAATILLQWQESSDGGHTWVPLVDRAFYGGTTTTTLTINGAPLSWNGLLYRIVGTNACGTTTSTAALLTNVLTGHTYQGPFVWYGRGPYDGSIGPGLNPQPLVPGGGPTVVRVKNYYLVQEAFGFSDMVQALYAPDGTNTIGGISLFNLGGAVVTNGVTGAVTGGYAGLWLYTGNFCSGDSWRGSYGSSSADVNVAVNSINITDLLPFYTYTITTALQTVYGTDAYTTPGYLATYCGNGVWGDPNKTADKKLSLQNSISNAQLAGGGSEITFGAYSAVTAWNSGTGAMTGTASVANIRRSRLSTTGSFLVTYTYTAVAIGGGPTYTFTEVDTVAAGVGNPLNTTKVVPMLVGYTVTITDVQVSDLAESADDFSTYDDGWTRTLGNGANWADAGTFGMPQPGECADDFDSLADGIYTVIYSGDNWPLSGGTFGQSDYAEADDDFRAYADGTTGNLYAGFGWANVGTFGFNDYPASYDDFSGWTAGSYDTLANGYIIWIGDGTFGLNDYLFALDDFSGYADGSYLTLTAGSGWAAAGTFG